MKKSLLYISALLTLLTVLAGCNSINAPQETAMQWMERQPNTLDP